jgi:hypothetical protein
MVATLFIYITAREMGLSFLDDESEEEEDKATKCGY